jgi:acyl-CoA thioester hydrolase
MIHEFPVRVYYEDTDAGGVVYHANFLKFCERARTEFIRTLGFECSTLEKEHGFLFVVRHLEADYFAPARLDDLLNVQTSLSTLKNSSFVLHQTVVGSGSSLFDMYVTLVCVDAHAFKPVRVPQNLRAQLKAGGGQ